MAASASASRRCVSSRSSACMAFSASPSSVICQKCGW
jgi:hypothetical protein